ncbi:uncharacterized protein LOC103316546 isoform X3 [Nasonia vitripennis]|uniref:Uncharacterized protein n=1 Tax=Nasonia vitripennis TaxID=7425 RepID=A0A7M7QF98_NASVI|nr:uncharacterized protein LOC103316546 isoform X3 [Nasonia vitripennis]
MEKTAQTTQNCSNYKYNVSDNKSNTATQGVTSSMSHDFQKLTSKTTKQPLELPYSLCSEIQSAYAENQNFEKKMLPNPHLEANWFDLQIQRASDQMQTIKQIKSIENPTTTEIMNVQDVTYQYHNFIKDNSQTSISHQCYDKKPDKFLSEIDLPSNSMEISKELQIYADNSYVPYNQNRVSAFQEKYENNGTNINIHSKSDIEIAKCSTKIGKAVSHPHLLYRDQTNNTNKSLTVINYQNKTFVTDVTTNNDKCKMFMKEMQIERIHKKNFTSENIDLCTPESSLEISTSVKQMSLDERLELEKAKKTLPENCEDNCETISTKSQKDSYIKQTNKIIQNCGQDEQKSFFVTDTSEFAKKAQQTDITKERTLYNKFANFKNYDKIKLNADQFKVHQQDADSDYEKTEQCSSVIDSGRGSVACSSEKKCSAEEFDCLKGQDAEWIDIVESELSNILGPNNIPTINHSNFSDSVSSVTPPLPPVTPPKNSRVAQNKFGNSLDYSKKLYYDDYIRNLETQHHRNVINKRDITGYKKQKINNYNDRMEAGYLTSTTTGLDLDSMLDRSDSDFSINDARTIKKQLDGLEYMYSEVLKLLGNGSKQRRKRRGLASYGSVSSLPTSSVSSRPLTKHYDKKKSHFIEDRTMKTKDIKNINKRFQRLESHVVTLARSVAHLSSEMRTQHLMIQEMENIRGEISNLRTQTNMAMIRSQSQPVLKDSDLPALSNPSRVKKLTKFFGVEPPLLRLFLRELGYEYYWSAEVYKNRYRLVCSRPNLLLECKNMPIPLRKKK